MTDKPPIPGNHPTFKHVELVNLPYFFTKFKNTEEVVRYLLRIPDKKSGCFLVRPSFSRPEMLSVSVIIPDGSVRHTSIQTEIIDNVKYYFLIKDVKNSVLHWLISYYKDKSITNLEKVDDVQLLYPVSKFTNSIMTEAEMKELLQVIDRMQSSASSTDSENWILKPDQNSKTIHNFTPTVLRQSSKAHIDVPPELAHQYRGRTTRADSLTNRPRAPLPTEGTKEEVKYYSSARDLTLDTSHQMRENLKANEICECGLRVTDSELPNGWSVHRSRDPRTFGKMFFQSPNGNTVWSPPKEIVKLFTEQQNDFLNQISNGDWEMKLVSMDIFI